MFVSYKYLLLLKLEVGLTVYIDVVIALYIDSPSAVFLSNDDFL